MSKTVVERTGINELTITDRNGATEVITIPDNLGYRLYHQNGMDTLFFFIPGYYVDVQIKTGGPEVLEGTDRFDGFAVIILSSDGKKLNVLGMLGYMEGNGVSGKSLGFQDIQEFLAEYLPKYKPKPQTN